ncbi:dynein axonemal heavy chain 5-like [Clytia hemisphaerica]|uniref:dynein axonemal heavy chain 5-like n=1 Tax=Clytia hemisphaerica TaxID=252671 RepID=UPI0034D3EC89
MKRGLTWRASIKRLQAKAEKARVKEEKEAKKAQLDARHEYLLGNISDALNVDYNEIVEHIIEGTQIETITSFFRENGSRSSLIFFYQQMEATNDGVDHMRLGHGGNQLVNKTKHKLFLTDGLAEKLTGFCLYFAKINKTKEITAQNIHNEAPVVLLKADHT